MSIAENINPILVDIGIIIFIISLWLLLKKYKFINIMSVM